MRYLILFFLMLTQSINSQNYVLKYEAIFNTSLPFTMDNYLFINDDFSCFKVDYNTRKAISDETDIPGLKGRKVRMKPANIIDLYYLKRDNPVLSFTQKLGKIDVLVKDVLPKIEWVISNESKQIDRFLAYKATGTFRGREWIAWFTPDLPYPYGPWKLNGLPGVILSVHDSEQRYAYKLVEVSSEEDLKIYNEFLDKTTNLRELSLKEYWEEYWEKLENALRTAGASSRSAVIKGEGFNRSNQIETIYEWEEDK